ncbi:MAG: nucleoside-diphosphate-sugar epimerase [Myxococcota bacterium]
MNELGGTDRHLLIVGCGYSGTVLAQRTSFKGIPTIGTTRSEQRAHVIRTRGAQPVLFDGTNYDALRRFRGRLAGIVYSIPPRMTPDGDAPYEDATAEFMQHIADWGVAHFVYISSTSVYGDKGGATVTESSETTPDSPRGKARLAIEAQVLAGPVSASVIRPAGIYGPGRSQLHRIAKGAYKLVGDGDAYTNRIHVVDLAALIEAALRRAEPGAIYLGTDTAPTTQKAVVDHIVETYGLPAPPAMPLDEARVRLSKNVLAMIRGSKQLDPTQTLADLKVRLRYPDFAKGLADIWRREAKAIKALAAP